MQNTVLIIGAGPTGLVLALWLTRQGVGVRIVDAAPGPGTTSRAVVIQARTLELYRSLGLAEAVLAAGHQVEAANVWVGGARKANIGLGALGEGKTPYPFIQIYPQDLHERLLVERLESLGVAVERRTELVGFTDHGDGVTAQLKGAGIGAESVEARFLVGCDGARSLVRRQLGLDFPGGTYEQLFYVADIEGEGEALNGELHVDLDDADFLAVFPLAPRRKARLIGTVRGERAGDDRLTFDDVSQRAIEGMRIAVQRVNWFSTYRVHHRVAEHFRKGRVFIAGDAGHIHSPAGGQGMNTGIGDAINLAWKLAAVLQGKARDGLLDSYEAERAPFARRLVRTTDRAFSFATANGPLANLVRTRLVPTVLPLALRLPGARDFMFRTISQTQINYRAGPLAGGTAGQVQGGDRLPFVRSGGQDNFAPLPEIAWQVHVYGSAGEALRTWCGEWGISLRIFPWLAEHQRAGLARDAAYLLRPDTYVAVADPSGDPANFEIFLKAAGIDPSCR